MNPQPAGVSPAEKDALLNKAINEVTQRDPDSGDSDCILFGHMVGGSGKKIRVEVENKGLTQEIVMVAGTLKWEPHGSGTILIRAKRRLIDALLLTQFILDEDEAKKRIEEAAVFTAMPGSRGRKSAEIVGGIRIN